MKKLVVYFLLWSAALSGQLQAPEKIELGQILEAYEIKGDLVLTNSSGKKIFLMRADADAGVKIYTSKKTLLAGDTCLLVISFIPENKGAFAKKIKLVASDRAQPYIITLTGSLAKVKQDDKLACYYFGNRRSSPVPVKEEPVFVQGPVEKRDVSNRIPDQQQESPRDLPPPAPPEKPAAVKDPPVKTIMFSEKEFRPNNLIFLVDISGSMKDSLKLPLMKNALHHLIDEIRPVDKLTFITYADTIKIIKEAANSEERQGLHDVVNNLKAKGMTKGRKAILFSQQVAQKNFITGGNNEIMIATDGKFRFEKEDQKLWNERQGEKAITLTTVAFGDEREAISNLKDIARKGRGSFIQIRERSESSVKLMDEIKSRSRR